MEQRPIDIIIHYIIPIDWKGTNSTIKMETWDVNSNQDFEYSVGLEQLQF